MLSRRHFLLGTAVAPLVPLATAVNADDLVWTAAGGDAGTWLRYTAVTPKTTVLGWVPAEYVDGYYVADLPADMALENGDTVSFTLCVDGEAPPVPLEKGDTLTIKIGPREISA